MVEVEEEDISAEEVGAAVAILLVGVGQVGMVRLLLVLQ